MTKKGYTVLILILLAVAPTLSAQFGYNNRFGNGRGQRVAPRAQTTPERPDPLTAEEIVELEMPKITEALKLNDFEQAVVSSILVKHVKQRLQLRLLDLEPEKARESAEKIGKSQDEELKAGLPEEKYLAFKELEEDGFKKKKKKKKKSKKQ